MEVLTPDEFIRINNVAVTHIRLLKIGTTETKDQVSPFTPWNDVRRSQYDEDRQEAGKK